MRNQQTELLAPAGDFETALSAFAAGADAIYCGLAEFSARAFAKNFSYEDLEKIIAYARPNGKKVYVTFNTLLDEDQIEGAVEILARLEEIGPDAIIVQDLGIAALCRKHFPSLVLHASTQLVAHNLEGVLALGELGFQRVVLARELSLEEITSLARRCGDIELECFIHGALCYSLSGLCLFGAMEKGRSGNRGTCPYCCRANYGTTDAPVYPFSMKDLRLGEDARKMVDAGVASLKIEGRMKSPLYVASVTRYYRDILDGNAARVRPTDLETVFSRRTTELYFNGKPRESVVDSSSLGHLGTPIGAVKKVTKDRDGSSWLRFHTIRALEKHDGLQFDALDRDGRHYGMGIQEMRPAISRHTVFETKAGTDVEILLPVTPEGTGELAAALRPGMTIYCSMSNAIRRQFPIPSFRPSDYPSGRVINLVVTLEKTRISVHVPNLSITVSIVGDFSPAKNPEKTEESFKKAFSRLGGTGYQLGTLTIKDPEHLFAPMSLLNDLRRDLVEELNTACEQMRAAKIEAVQADAVAGCATAGEPARRLKIRLGQSFPRGDWNEIVVAIDSETTASYEEICRACGRTSVRLGLPVYTSELTYNRLRVTVKRLLHEGATAWEASDLSTLRMLTSLKITNITADWTLYAFNAQALDALSQLGARRFVASPENDRENLQYLAESGYAVEFLEQQSTPLFMSLTQPASEAKGLSVFRRSGLWVTTHPTPRTYTIPTNGSSRVDLSWDPV